MEIPLRFSELVAIVDDDDFERLAKFPWRLHNQGYATFSVGGRKNRKYYLMHRMIMGDVEGYVIDHINGDRLDNRKANLRWCTVSDNLHNRKPKPNRSGYTGVSKHKSGLWRARVRVNGKEIATYHKSKRAAAEAYKRLAQEHYGEFYRAA